MEERPRVECKSILDAHTLDPTAEPRVVTHTLKTSNTVALCVSGERVVEELPVGNESAISSFTTASNTLDQASLLLAQTQYDNWKKIPAGTPAMLDLPTDRPRASHHSNDVSNIPILLDALLTQSLTKIALEHNMGLNRQRDTTAAIGSIWRTKHLPASPAHAEDASSSTDHQGLSLDNIARINGPSLFQVALRWNQERLRHAVPILVDLELQLQEQENEIVGNMLFPKDLFNPDTIRRHVGYLLSMLQAMVVDVDRPVVSVDLLSQAERELILGEWNETQQDYPDHLCIHHLFEQQVERTPQATALVFNGQLLSYSELNERANRLAHNLIGLGVQPESPVAICVGRSFAMIIGVLAILKAGGAYVPLDPSYVSERLQHILMDASPGVLIADHQGQQALGGCNPFANPQVPGLISSNLAYIIYTSGSTGKPKGVMVEHHGLSNLVMTRHDVYGICTSSRVLQFLSLAFDACSMSIFMTLCSGASLHLIPDTSRYDLRQLWEYIDQGSITHAPLTPAIFQDAKDLPLLDTSVTLIFGGESIPVALIRVLQPLIPNGKIVNDYGPTEATVSAIAWKCPPEFDDTIVPIGRPIANKTIYLLDKHRQPVPIGATGELAKDARMYKTGDLGRYLPDGNIVFLGRNDYQVKIRGFRIELGEIEARLCDISLVDKAVVTIIGERSDRRLVGYVVAKPDDDLLSTLRSHLKSCLPDYMVPAAIVRLDSLPLNSNGKLDRMALPVPDSDAFTRQKYEAPQGDTEITVAKIWAELLHLDRVSRNDDFFALGGYSLLAVRMLNRLRQLGLATSIKMLPLINLSQADIDHIVEQTPGGVANIQDIYSLSPFQDGILFHHLLATKGDMYLLSARMAFDTRDLLDRYLKAFQEVVDRHDILRTAFVWENISTPAQVAPLLRFMIAQDTEGRWILFQLVHHLIGDHAAGEIRHYEIEQILHGQGHSLSTPHPFRNAIAQVRSKNHRDIHVPLFMNMIGDVSEPTFSYGMAKVQDNGAHVAESHSILPQGLNNRLRFQAQQMGCSECVRQAHTRLAALLEHEHASLALAQKCSAVSPVTPSFSALLNYLHTSLPPGSSERLDTEHYNEEEQVHFPGIEFLGGRERTNYPFGINVLDYDTALGLAVQTQQPVNPSRVESYMKQALESLVDALENDPDVAVLGLEVLPIEERKLLLHGLNKTQQDYPSRMCIHHLFEQQVELNRQAMALVLNGHSMTYTELNVRANRLAHHLIGLGVQPETRVAICVERSISMIVGVFAILKAGGAYVPLDPAFASERLLDILMDASPGILVADDRGKQALGNDISASLTVIDPNVTGAGSRSKSDAPGGSYSNPQVPGLTSRNLVYIIYTSGSTGKPKGVMVEHQGLVSLVTTRPEVYGISASSRMTQFFSIAFDAHAFDVFMVLCTGGSLHILADDIRMDLPRLWDYLERESITQTVLTPAVLQHCNGLPQLSKPLTLITTAEATTSKLIKAMYQLIPAGKIVNGYGPTETTVSAIAWECPRDFEGTNVPIGRPIANKTIYLLDKYRQPVPLGAVGELYIGGVGVARGYLNRPDLTSMVFLPDPFVGNKDARMYKTGDLTRYLPDGTLVYLGRNDHQVKIRGFRIELDDNLLNTLRSHLTSCLPEYMVPAAIIRLDSLPINSNGKLDRKALPVPDDYVFARKDYEAPQGETETTMAGIWAELLHLDRVGRNDNFFALGGHSLHAVQMIERLRRVSLTLSVSALFKTPTLSTLVQSLDVHHDCNAPTNIITPDTTIITPEMLPLISLSQSDIDHIVERVPGGVTNIQDIYSLSPLQEGILFHHLLATEGDPYLLISFMAFQSRVLLDKYLEANQMVVNRHDILRTAILDPRRHRVDLTQAPLLRFTIAQDADGRWILAQLHHLIGDNTTVKVASIETKALMDGQGHTLPAPQPFRNLIAQARSSHSQDDHERFFKEMLMDIDTPSFPFGLKDVHSHGDNVSSSYQQLPQDLNDRLRKQAKQLGVSVASLCHVAWAQVVSRTSGEDRVVFGTVLFGRMNSGRGSDSAMGLFINTLPLRVDVTGPVRESVLQTHERLATLLEHEHASLVLAQRCSNVPQGTPLFSSLLNYRHNVSSFDEISISTDVKYLEHQERTNYPFTLSVEDHGVSLGLTANVIQPFSSIRVCGYMQQALESLAIALEHAPAVNTREMNIVPEGEQELLLRTWNKTRQDYPDHLCTHHLFEQQVDLTPEATALVFNGQSLTYAKLNERSNRLAHHLIGLGVLPDSLVDARPRILVADAHGQQALGVGTLSSLTVVDPNVMEGEVGSNSAAPDGSLTNPQVPGLTSSHLAYVIYTSGSTGKSKGVMVEHQSLVNLIMTRHNVFGVRASSRMLQFFSFAFDGCVVSVFTSLCYGGSLHLLPDAIRMDPPQLWDYLERESITQVILTPSVLQDCRNLPQLSISLTLIVAGEASTTSLLKVIQQLNPNGRIVNDYGPTEATVSAIAWKCPPDFGGDIVPIGRPIANNTVYILDENRQPVPIGAVGELYIGGVGVARGYLNRPELTSQVFLPNPFAADVNARMYKTGDLARYQPDGNIVFLGRNDHQVKIRGFRVELGEIEARFNDHPLVDKAAVIAVGEGPDKKLVGYVVAKPDDELVKSLRSHLTSCLPEYMVPAAIVRLDSLPLNSNGKLDRKALPVPDDDPFARQIYKAPQGETEISVAKIWEELLQLERMIERLRRIDLTLAVSALFKTPTLSALVQSLDVHHVCEAPTNLLTPQTTTITPEMLPLISLSQADIDYIVRRVPGGVANIQDIYALSPLQEGILFHHLLATEGDPYMLISLMAFETRELLDKHDILRTAILHDNLSTPAQVVWRHASLSVTEFDLNPSDGPITDQLKQRVNPQKHRIDLTRAPLLSFNIAQDADGRWLLAGLIHHLIGDHTTLEPFRNLIAQAQSSRSQDDHEGFFREMLMDIDTPSLPFGLKDVHGQGDNFTSSYQQLPEDLNDRLRRQAKQLGVSVASLCHLAWAQVISHTSGEDRVVFGTVLFGRMNSERGSDSAMGLFINTLPLRVDLAGTVRGSVLQTHERLASLLEHEHASLALAQRCSNVPQGTPLFSAILNYRHNTVSSDPTSVAAGIEFIESQERTNYPFGLSVEDSGVSLGLTAEVVQPFSPVRVCGYMRQAIESLVCALEHGPDMMSTRELNILPEDEQELLLRTWNNTQQGYPTDLCIHHLFEQKVDLTPEATALVFNGQSLTYAELNDRANGLAHNLIGLGVQPDGLVAICVERSFAMIVAVLGIFKAGGAYVPLDPAYPSYRLRDILADAAPSIVIADESGRRALGEGILSSLTVVVPDPVIALDKSKSRHTPNPQVQDITPNNLAYVIFTSGSTGKPKGVMIEHRGVVNFAQAHTEFCGIQQDCRVLSWSSLSFDASVWDIVLPLSSGASLHLMADSIRQDRDKVWEYMAKHSITHASPAPLSI
ncbi:MAG: amino acid adenylation domain-containing protein [Benniella sp.]|nr:MAG: amino acid adenylation domain-containing protein [Benniella sp.]